MEEQKFVQIEGVTVITAAANPSATTSELNIESNNTSSGDCMHIDSGSDMQQQQ